MISHSDRLALRTLQLSALLVVLVAAPYKQFDLDRFFVPKDLVITLCALFVGLLCVASAKHFTLTRADELLSLALGLTAISALFATNWWLAERSLAVALAGAVCFWCARRLARQDGGDALVKALALAGIVGAGTALAQAYGLRLDYFSLNRAPGGTFGNRNFMAHLAAIVFPAALYCSLRAPSRASLLRWCTGLAILGAALVLSRSRAAWLALIGGLIVLALGLLVAFRSGKGAHSVTRIALAVLLFAAGAGIALVLPNTLDWRSDSPYMETAQGLVNYKAGSGHGRLIQYKNTIRMTAHHPILGVGPGNWAVVYPKFAAANDPSLGQDGMTSNPWPSSDWVAFTAERGPVATAALALALLLLGASAVKTLWRSTDVDARVKAAAFVATLAATMIVSMFDAVLLLPAPALIAWALLGSFSPDAPARRQFQRIGGVTVAIAVLAAAGVAAAVRSGAQIASMSLYSGTTKLSVMEQAVRADPGSFRIQTRLAGTYESRGDCKKARPHAAAARKLFPSSPLAKRLASACP